MESGISGNAVFSGAQGAVNQFESFLGTQVHVISNFQEVVERNRYAVAGIVWDFAAFLGVFTWAPRQ